jgi:Flp pilus assembly protein TadG
VGRTTVDRCTAIARRLLGDQRGQSMVEFALISPVFFLILVGIVDLGQGFFQYQQLNNAVSEGARVATYNQDPTTIKNTVVARQTIGLTTSNVTVTCYVGWTTTTQTCANGLDIGDAVKVTATKTFSPFTGRIIAIVGSNINLSATAQRSVQ